MMIRIALLAAILTSGAQAFAGHMHQSPLMRRNFPCTTPKPNSVYVQIYGPGYVAPVDRPDCVLRRIMRGQR